METRRLCTNCKHIKPISDFHRFGSKYQTVCKECQRRQCKLCGEVKNITHFHSAGKGNFRRGICDSCRSKMRKELRLNDPVWLENERAKRREQYARMSQRDFEMAVEHYGGKCTECGEDRIEALLLHHTEYGKEIKNKFDMGRKKNPWFYSQLRKWKYPPGLVVLCGTCHLILHRTEK